MAALIPPAAAAPAAAAQGSNASASMDAIRKHAADARWLDALDALDALSADEIDDEALAAEVRHHGGRFRSARAAFEDPDDDNHQWQGRTERFGVETAFRYDEDGLLWLRTAGNMEDVDLFHTVAVLREIQLFGEWIPFLRQSCVVKAQDFARLLAHFTIGVRGVLSRDCVFRVAACNHALSGASLFFEGRSLDDDVTEWNGAAVPPRDRSWGMDRMVVRDFYARVQFLSQFAQRCEVVVCVDLRTRLPRAVLDFFMKRLVGLFIWLWRRQSRYVSAHEQCPHRDAIAKDPAFYDEWLRPKFVEFCAAQGWDGGELVVDPADIEPDVVHDEAPPTGLFARLNPFG
ncbi:unnamed protein product [Pelagomonas calceolata]|uniref:START domain-containing protein n=1 Tax=Pelagomonas calceolata TaxID=35677 RepID=A0A7S4A3N9_9STRA|nr:unnamed protein product [Pelagomonas calceolata]|mmetsp:Transcript_18657/g.57627  ORF Transcript_18657/g.57627 Transcript_18657/m.57627 type:complete len:345 (+) Transcript_18657:88-1122(+)